MVRTFILSLLVACVAVAARSEPLQLVIGYLERVETRPPVLSNLEPIPEDEGRAGLELAIAENATTGKFLGHSYEMETRIVPPDGDILAAARLLLARTPYLVIKAPPADLLAIADLAEAKDALLFNAAAPDRALRDEDCRANLLHTLPSRAMLADALAQLALKKRWQNWVLIAGSHPGDAALGAALERSAIKFGIEIKARKSWAYDADIRRSAAAEVPLFMQDLPEHDLVVVADELGDFARYMLFNTWIPRPFAGSEGAVPAAWHPAVEQHGAVQLQNRFRDLANRPMRPVDFAAWAAGRALGEAVTRTGAVDQPGLRAYLLSDAFALSGFKGRPLTFRTWNGQLRQPIPIAHSRAVVALAPLEGFLHHRNELDTLGLDAPESRCTAFQE